MTGPLVKSCSEPLAGDRVAPGVRLNFGAKWLRSVPRFTRKLISWSVDITFLRVSVALRKQFSHCPLVAMKACSMSHSALRGSSLKHDVSERMLAAVKDAIIN